MEEKIIITCPKCKKKFKVTAKKAKYRCPHCKEIYKYNTLKGLNLKVSSLLIGIKNFPRKVKQKWQNFVNTYRYIRSVQKNLKNNPNWSETQKEKNRMKRAQKTNHWENLKDKFQKK